MPVSKKQLRANRQNAQKSTGPKSVEGKAIASRNGTKYGLYSQDIIITSTNLKENKEEYDHLLTSLLGELQPQTGMQLYLVHKIANALWRSRRAIRAETAIVTRQLDHIDRDLELRNKYLGIVREIDDDDDDDDDEEYEMTPEEEEQFRAIEVGRQSIPNDRFAVNILRYEMRLDRQLTRAYKLLCQLQDRQDSKQADTGAPTEVFVPVFKCPAEHGLECPRNPQQAAVSMENHDRAGRDAVESRPGGAGHPGPGGGRSTHENTKNDKPNPFPRNESVAAGLSRQGPPEADDLPPVNRGDGMGKNTINNNPNPLISCDRSFPPGSAGGG